MTNQGLTKAYQRKQLVRTYGEKGLIELPWKSVYSDKVSRNVCLIVIYNFVADAYLQKMAVMPYGNAVFIVLSKLLKVQTFGIR